MAYKNFEDFQHGLGEQSDITKIKISGNTLDLPDASFITDAEITRDGMDLVLDGPKGEVIIEDYFAAADAPTLTAPNGNALTPELVNSFVKSAPEYAQNATMSDVSPIGAVDEINGDVSVTRTDGSTETLSRGAPVYQGDIIETAANGAVNIQFIDESSFAVSEDSRLAIDEYVFDPSTSVGTQDFSVLKGVFVYTSGLIGREDPDDVSIDTPMGSIGIRGTIIAGDVNEGQITVVEGAIVLRDHNGFEMTLANQFETAKFSNEGNGIENMGAVDANVIMSKFAAISNVSPGLFSSIGDAARENTTGNDTQQGQGNANGAADQNNDNEIDGTIENSEPQQESAPSERSESEQPQEERGNEQGNENANEAKAKQQTTTDFGTDASGIDTKNATAALTEEAAKTVNDITKMEEQVNHGKSDTKTNNSEKNDAKQNENGKETLALDPKVYDEPETAQKMFVDLVWNPTDEVPQTVAGGGGETPTAVVLGTVTGKNTSDFNVHLEGSDSITLDLVQVGTSKTWEIQLQAGGSYLNYELFYSSDFDVQLVASNSKNEQVVIEGVVPIINDLNDTPQYLNSFGASATSPYSYGVAGVPLEYFKGTSDNHWSFRVSDIAADEDLYPGIEGEIVEVLTYGLTGATIDFLNGAATTAEGVNVSMLLDSGKGGDLDGSGTDFIGGNGWTFNTITGQLDMHFNDSSAWNTFNTSSFNIEFTITDLAGATTQTDYDFELLGGNGPGGLIETIPEVLTAVPEVLTGTPATNFSTNDETYVDIQSDSIYVLTGDGDDWVDQFGSHNGLYINTGDGDDWVDFYGGMMNVIMTGYGDDRITLDEVSQTYAYGMSGSDWFDLTSDQVIGMEDGSLAGNIFDGGSDIPDSLSEDTYDTLFLELVDSQVVDFSAILTNNSIQGIEVIDIVQDNLNPDTETNAVLLTYEDVLKMTDQNNSLLLNMGEQDTLAFDAEGHGDDVVDGTYTDDFGQTFDVYDFGEVSLLVSQDAGDVNISNATV